MLQLRGGGAKATEQSGKFLRARVLRMGVGVGDHSDGRM